MDHAQACHNSVYDSVRVMEQAYPGAARFYFSAGSSDLGAVLKYFTNVYSSLVSVFSSDDSVNSTIAIGSAYAAHGIGKVAVESIEADSSRDLKAAEFVRGRLDYIYDNDAASYFETSHSRVALRGVVDAVEDLLEVGDYTTLDALLGAVEPASLKKMTSVAFLRSSYRERYKLTNWSRLYAAVWVHLNDTNQNPARALRGLVRERDARIA